MRFSYEGEAEAVCVGGDFNSWSAASHCMEKDGERFSIEIALTPGRYAYGFNINHNGWRPDPNAVLVESDGFGGRNSVIVVR